MVYASEHKSTDDSSTSVPFTPKPHTVELGSKPEADSRTGARPAQEGAVPPATEQARDMASRIDALSAQHAVAPELRELARKLATELGAEHLSAPAGKPEGLPGSLTDQIRPVQEVAHDLVRRLKRATENSRPLREQLAGAIKTAGELDRRLTRLLDNDLSQPGLQTPSPGSPAGPFPMKGPAGDRVVGWVTPELSPATLKVAAPSHGQVHVPVLARFFPAHTVHARKSAAVVAGDHCQLQSMDHYHVHRLSLSLDPLLNPGSPGHAALQELLKDRSENGLTRFQERMQAIADTPEHRETQASVPVRDNPHTLVTSAQSVQRGDGSRTNVTTHYLVDEAELHIVELLARDRELARSLVAAVDEPESGAATRKFLRDAARSAGRTDDLALLDHCTGLRERDTSIYWLFGVNAVSGASGVLIGRDNELRTDMRVDRGGLSRSTLLADLGQIREQAAQVREGVAAGPQRSDLTRAATPGVPRAARVGPDWPQVRAVTRSPEDDIVRGTRRRDLGRGDTGRGGVGRG
jgi:hypothetical protein